MASFPENKSEPDFSFIIQKTKNAISFQKTRLLQPTYLCTCRRTTTSSLPKRLGLNDVMMIASVGVEGKEKDRQTDGQAYTQTDR
jgi:hypothetical protein